MTEFDVGGPSAGVLTARTATWGIGSGGPSSGDTEPCAQLLGNERDELVLILSVRCVSFDD